MSSSKSSTNETPQNVKNFYFRNTKNIKIDYFQKSLKKSQAPKIAEKITEIKKNRSAIKNR